MRKVVLNFAVSPDGFIDEMQLSVHPVLLCADKPLFSNIKERTNPKLTDTKTYLTGAAGIRLQ